LDQLLHELGSPDVDRRVQAERVWAEHGRISRGEAIFRRFITDDLDGFEREYRQFLRQRILNGAASGREVEATKPRSHEATKGSAAVPAAVETTEPRSPETTQRETGISEATSQHEP
jgi:hypothetical protein